MTLKAKQIVWKNKEVSNSSIMDLTVTKYEKKLSLLPAYGIHSTFKRVFLTKDESKRVKMTGHLLTKCDYKVFILKKSLLFSTFYIFFILKYNTMQ